MAKKSKKVVVAVPNEIELKLDLGCGDNKKEGYLGVDKFKTASTDFVQDLFEFPWQWKDESVDALFCSQFVEHIPAAIRPRFFEEAWRVLKPDAQFVVIVPYWASMRSVQDFTHEWPPICEATFLYWNKSWREQNKLLHGAYDIKCNFDFTYGYSLDQELVTRNQEWQQFAIKHYLHAATDLHVTLTKRPM